MFYAVLGGITFIYEPWCEGLDGLGRIGQINQSDPSLRIFAEVGGNVGEASPNMLVALLFKNSGWLPRGGG